MKKVIYVILSWLFIISANVFASGVSNGFLIEKKTLDFFRTLRLGECGRIVPYPILPNDDEAFHKNSRIFSKGRSL